MLMNARIISKHDAKVLQAATNILSRLQHESNSRLDAWRKSAKSHISRDYWNAQRKHGYFVNVCKKHGINVACSGRISIEAQ